MKCSADGWVAFALFAIVAAAAPSWAPSWAQGAGPSFKIVDHAIPASLTGKDGDPARGRAIVVNRQMGLCLLCHSGPFPEERFQGDIAPDLRGAGSRFDAGQLRLRLVDSSKLNPDSTMPAYYRDDGGSDVAPAFRGKTILSAEQIEDVVAFLRTLRD